MNDNKMKTLITLPAYNVGKSLIPIIKSLSRYQYDCLYINDGSSDDTLAILKSYNCTYLSNKFNMGISYSLMRALDYAVINKYECLITMDADGQHDPCYIPSMVRLLENNNLVIGRRFFNGMSVPNQKKASNYLASSILLEMYDRKFLDISCGFKGFHISSDLIDSLKKSSKYEYVFDILIYFLERNSRIAEINMEPIYFYEEMLSTRRIEIISFLNSLFRNCTKAKSNKISRFFDDVNQKSNFIFEINDMIYYGFYLEINDSYIIQCEEEKLNQYCYEGRSDVCFPNKNIDFLETK